MQKNKKILSLFDGMSVAQQSLKELKIDVDYYASEIDPFSITVTQANFPNTIQYGDVKKLTFDFRNSHGNYIQSLFNFDLLIGGSPCQDLSVANVDGKGLEGNRSSLFFEFARILKEMHPRYFILENVASMKDKDRQIISQTLGINPVMLDASLVSAQSRKRLFWVGELVTLKNGDATTNETHHYYRQVEIKQPKDKGITLKDIIDLSAKRDWVDTNRIKSQRKTKNYLQYDLTGKNHNSQDQRAYYLSGKHGTLPAYGCKTKVKFLHCYRDYERIGCLTVKECLQLQGLPKNYFDKLTVKMKDAQQFKMIGNAFNCQIIKHIIKHLDL